MVFFGRSFGKFSLQKKWSLRRQRRELSTTSSQLYPGHGPEITSVSDAIPWWPPPTVTHFRSEKYKIQHFQDPIMYQHSNSLHAEILHVPFLQQIPQKLHSSSGFVSGCQGTGYDISDDLQTEI